MKIIGCDFHTRYQQIAMLDEETGELVERRLEHENGEGGCPRSLHPFGGWPIRSPQIEPGVKLPHNIFLRAIA